MTLSGWSLLATSTGLAVTGWWTGSGRLLALAAALGCLLAVGIVHVWRPAQLEVTVRLDRDRVTPGEYVAASIEVRNLGEHVSPVLRITLPRTAGAPIVLPPLAPGTSHVVPGVPVDTSARSATVLAPAVVRLDVAAVVRRRLPHGTGPTLFVHPERTVVRVPPGSANGVGGSRTAGHRPGSDPTAWQALRDYRSGDDARSIDWRTSARRDRLVVRELAAPALLTGTVLVDLRAAAYEPYDAGRRAFETAVEVAASLVASMLAAGRTVELVTSNGQEMEASIRSGHRYLDLLASVRATPAGKLALPPGRLRRAAHPVTVVTGTGDAVQIRSGSGLSFAHQRLASGPVTVLRLGGAPDAETVFLRSPGLVTITAAAAVEAWALWHRAVSR